MEKVKYLCTVADYEHSGDLDAQVSEIKSLCPEASNFKTWEEEDLEAESDYSNDYGECDEPIYQGYVEFMAPKEYQETLESIGCYKSR